MPSNLTPADFDALMKLEKAGDPRAKLIQQKMTPDELSDYTTYMGPVDIFGGQTGPGGAKPSAGLMAADAAILGGAGTLAIPAARAAVAASAARVWPAAKYAAGAYGISQLPIPNEAKTALEIIFGMNAMKGNPGRAAEEMPQRVMPESEAEYLARTGHARGYTGTSPSQKPFGPSPAAEPYPPNVILGGPSTMGRAPRKPGMFGFLADQGGESDVQWHDNRPSTTTRRSPSADFDEAAKRQAMFGGVRVDSDVPKPSDKLKSKLRSPKK